MSMKQWIIYTCECGLRYGIEEEQDDEIEEPCCPVCGSNNSTTEGSMDVHYYNQTVVM